MWNYNEFLTFFWSMWLFIAFACAYVAWNKRRNVVAWFLMGLLFSLLGLLILAMVPARSTEIIPTAETHVRCPDCQELVMKNARICKHCRCRLVPDES